MSFFQPPHPQPVGRFVITTRLTHFVMITYRVDVQAAAAAIGDHRFVPVQVGGHALVSAVHFVDEDFSISLAPGLKLRFLQTNYRLYVTDLQDGVSSVWFFGTALGSPWASIPKHAWQMPWCESHHELTISRNNWRYDCSGWGRATAEVEPDSGIVESLPDFSDVSAAHLLLTHPYRGLFRRRDGAIGSYSISHPPMGWRLGQAKELDHPVFAECGVPLLGLHSVLTAESIPFVIGLPPQRRS